MSAPEDDERHRRYRPKILAELGELSEASAASESDRRPVALDQQSVGRLSRMDAMQAQAMAAAVEARRGQRRARLLAALERMDTGEYGYCIGCGDCIGDARLAIDAAALTCVGCRSQ
ncbi:MAG: TraR/DksA family transcriptional regulator [Rhodobacteraceae bacterium]|nr:TraR/DksA family transcriptional regulator [Paracoccaceae bacterium]